MKSFYMEESLYIPWRPPAEVNVSSKSNNLQQQIGPIGAACKTFATYGGVSIGGVKLFSTDICHLRRLFSV